MLADQKMFSVYTCARLNANFAECFRSSYCVSRPLRCTTCLSYGEKIITVGAVSSKDDFSHFVFSVSSHSTPLPSSSIDDSEQFGWKDYWGLPIISIREKDGERKRERERMLPYNPNFTERKSERKCPTSEAIVK